MTILDITLNHLECKHNVDYEVVGSTEVKYLLEDAEYIESDGALNVDVWDSLTKVTINSNNNTVKLVLMLAVSGF